MGTGKQNRLGYGKWYKSATMLKEALVERNYVLEKIHVGAFID